MRQNGHTVNNFHCWFEWESRIELQCIVLRVFISHVFFFLLHTQHILVFSYGSLVFLSSLAWLSFTLCMSASVLTLNTYTKTILEFKYRRRIFEKNVRECNPFLDSEMVRFLWEKYIFSVSGTLEDPLNWHKGFGSPIFVDIGSITDLPGAAKEEERSIEVENDGEQC